MDKKQPTASTRKQLNDINSDNSDLVQIPGAGSVKVGFIRPFTSEKLTELYVNADIDLEKVDELGAIELMSRKSSHLHKLVALAVLNRFWKIKMFYWILWRWYYYVKEYTYDQLFPIVAESKKKIPLEMYLLGMGLGAMMSQDKMNLTKMEAEQYRQELSRVSGLLSERNTGGL